MNKLLALFCIAGLLLSCNQETETLSVTSPNRINTIDFHLSAAGVPTYLVSHNEKVIIDASTMGFDFKDQNALKGNLKILSSEKKAVHKTWEMPWGEQRMVDNTYNQLDVVLAEKNDPKRKRDQDPAFVQSVTP